MVGAGAVGGAAAPVYPSLRGVRLMELTAQIANNEDAIRWAQRQGVIAGSQTCSRCPGTSQWWWRTAGKKMEDVGAVQLRAAAARARCNTAASTPIQSYPSQTP